MKKLLVAALIAGQVATGATPARAADLGRTETQQVGAFGGLSLRVPLGASHDRRVRAGLAFAPVAQSRAQDGAVRTRIGEGLELGIAGDRPLELSFAGQRLDRIGDRRAGISTLGWVGIGVGVLAVGVVLLFESCRAGDICGSDRDS